MKLRVAKTKDIPILVKLGELFVKESPSYSQRGFVPERASAHLQSLIDGAGVVFLAEDQGEIVGAYVGGITQDWQSYHKLAFDYVMYVHPLYRGRGVAKELTEVFIEWAKAMGANRINCGTATQVNTDACVQLYESFGFQKVGVFLELEV